MVTDHSVELGGDVHRAPVGEERVPVRLLQAGADANR